MVNRLPAPTPCRDLTRGILLQLHADASLKTIQYWLHRSMTPAWRWSRAPLHPQPHGDILTEGGGVVQRYRCLGYYRLLDLLCCISCRCYRHYVGKVQPERVVVRGLHIIKLNYCYLFVNFLHFLKKHQMRRRRPRGRTGDPLHRQIQEQ